MQLAAEAPAFRDESVALDARVEDLLDRLTLAEKAGQVPERGAGHSAGPTT